MAKLVSLFISRRQQTIIAIVVGSLIFLVLTGGAGVFALYEARQSMRAESRVALAPYAQIRRNLDSTFAELEKQVTAAPCSAEFREQLRRVAFLPDGFHEFLYVVDGAALCSASIGVFETPLQFGEPDIRVGAETVVWMQRDLSFSGFEGLFGSIVQEGDFAIVVRQDEVPHAVPQWMEFETVATASSGRRWHLDGVEGVFDANRQAAIDGTAPLSGTVRSIDCGDDGMICVATQASLTSLLARVAPYAIVALLFSALLSAVLAIQARALIVRRWAFDARFRRYLDAETVVCGYQPIMELATGRIAGCEVLARWRDIDDTIVYPDRFIPLVERYGLTRQFTRMVVEKAHRELSAAMPAGLLLKVTFNVFPRDLDSAVLCDIFGPFLAEPERFRVIIELVESDAIDMETAPREIERLRDTGIRTYIDDFGSGYSNIQNLAALSVDGVKLDRAFAMAPADSMMARMLYHAVEMIHSSGRMMVVEGIETAERLEELRAFRPAIDFVQGYHISRPLGIEPFAGFLADASRPDQLIAKAA
ncbi:EAL domain-containing protein [Aurantimonas coralicida]|uniref:EAL domain-containing protein n=1 Tax=Aurantimonas coralicida TaxID=182270 RepID=UPI0004249F34|nr:EAL domain-containing protein [Aurantimonas coralicida]